jgi:hypothetical protein
MESPLQRTPPGGPACVGSPSKIGGGAVAKGEGATAKGRPAGSAEAKAVPRRASRHPARTAPRLACAWAQRALRPARPAEQRVALTSPLAWLPPRASTGRARGNVPLCNRSSPGNRCRGCRPRGSWSGNPRYLRRTRARAQPRPSRARESKDDILASRPHLPPPSARAHRFPRLCAAGTPRIRPILTPRPMSDSLRQAIRYRR